MPMRDGSSVEFGVRILADNTVFLNGVKASSDALKELKDKIGGAAEATDKARGAQENLTASIFKGVTATQVLFRAWDEGVRVFRDVVDATADMQRGQAQLEAVLKATGGAAGQTSESINELVNNLAKVTRFTDSDLKRAATSMLTFDGVTGQTFERILKLSADLASTGRGDLETWSTVLSKVAQAPVESVGLLERALGKFDSTLKVATQNAVFFGDKQKAINILLNEVATRAGGAATESYRGLERQIDGTAKAWTKLKETVGEEIFNAKSRDASVFERALVSMADTFKSRVQAMKDVFANIPPGLLQMLGIVTGVTTAQAIIKGPDTSLEGLRRARDVALSYGGTTTELDRQIELAAAAERRANMPAHVDYDGPPGTARPAKPDLLNIQQRQQLRDQDLRNAEDYTARLFKTYADENQRELDILESSHELGLINEATYFSRKAQLRAKDASDAAESITQQIAKERQLLGNAQAELTRAKGVEGPNQQAEVFAAEQRVHDIKARINVLTLDQAEAEKKVGDAVRKTGDERALVVRQQQDSLVAIARDSEDFQRGLARETQEMQAQLGLIGQDELAVRLANNERRITNKLADDLLVTERKIQDLRAHGKDLLDPEVQALVDEMEALKGAAAQAISDQAALIKQTYSAEFFASFSHDLADALITGGKNAGAKIRQILEDALKKPFVIALQGLIQGGLNSLMGGLLGNAGSSLLGGSGGVGGSLLGAAGEYLFGSAEGATSTGLLTTGTEGLIGTGGFTATMGSAATSLATAFGAAEAGAAAFGEAVMAAIPVVGWIAAAAMLAYQIFGNQGPHADKQQGSFAGTFDPTGHLGSTLNPDLSGITGDNQNPAAAQQMAQFIANSYAQAMNALGITGQSLNIASGFSTDPQGTAPSFVHTRVTNAAGENILSRNNDNVGRGADDLSAEMRLESEAAVVAGIKAAMGALPQALQDILKDVDPATASLAQLDDALKKLFEMQAVIQGLRELGFHGLDVSIESLTAWQRTGESLTQTFQRVAGQWNFFEQNFMTSSQRLASAQRSVTSAFDELGITAPTTVEGFAAIVEGIDKNTESGRHMYDVLMAIAPAFLNIATAGEQARAAMEQASQGFAQAAIAMHGGAGGALGREWARGQLEVAAQHWLDTVGNDSGTQTVASVIANIPNVDPAAALGYARGAGTEGVEAITALFSAYNQWQNALNTGAPALSNFTTQIQQTTAGLTDFQRAQSSLGDWLKGLAVDSSLSPLSPMERLGLAGNDWQAAVTAAQGGDATAAGKVQGLSQTYLGIAQELFAHGPQFVDIFNKVFNADAGVAGVPDLNSRLSSVLPPQGKLVTGSDIETLGTTIGTYLRDYLMALSSDNQAAIAASRDAIVRKLDVIAASAGPR